ncbi:hypothetical protein ACWIUD_02040 [Helicobacter sp. 23-1044]
MLDSAPLILILPPPNSLNIAESSAFYSLFSSHKYLFLSVIIYFVYFCAFSIASASVIGACFAFVCLAFCAFKNGVSIKAVFKSIANFGAFEAVCVAILAFSAFAILGEIKSDRADYCEFSGMNFAFGAEFLIAQFRKISRFWRIILIAFPILMAIYFAIKRSAWERIIFFMSLAWIILLCVAFLGICSKCGATYHLVSGLFLSLFYALGVWLGICFRVHKIFSFIIPFLLIYALLQGGFKAYDERPRASYEAHRQWVQKWLDSAKNADSAGFDVVDFEVPDNFAHLHQQSWLWDSFSRTLYTYGITKKRLKVRFVKSSTAKEK